MAAAVPLRKEAKVDLSGVEGVPADCKCIFRLATPEDKAAVIRDLSDDSIIKTGSKGTGDFITFAYDRWFGEFRAETDVYLLVVETSTGEMHCMLAMWVVNYLTNNNDTWWMGLRVNHLFRQRQVAYKLTKLVAQQAVARAGADAKGRYKVTSTNDRMFAFSRRLGAQQMSRYARWQAPVLEDGQLAQQPAAQLFPEHRVEQVRADDAALVDAVYALAQSPLLPATSEIRMWRTGTRCRQAFQDHASDQRLFAVFENEAAQGRRELLGVFVLADEQNAPDLFPGIVFQVTCFVSGQPLPDGSGMRPGSTELVLNIIRSMAPQRGCNKVSGPFIEKDWLFEALPKCGFERATDSFMVLFEWRVGDMEKALEGVEV
eukprot:m.8805 g.8805  ORF g.8805 m.8805 type:complete len:374 (-) comp5299_c0_seq1:1661-2782(-)